MINTMFKEYNDVSSYSDLFSSRGPFLSSQFYTRGYKVKLKRKKKKTRRRFIRFPNKECFINRFVYIG